MYLHFTFFLDKMKFQSIAKLCSQCEEYYAETVKLMEREPIMLSLDKDWVQHVSIIDLFIKILLSIIKYLYNFKFHRFMENLQYSVVWLSIIKLWFVRIIKLLAKKLLDFKYVHRINLRKLQLPILIVMKFWFYSVGYFIS